MSWVRHNLRLNNGCCHFLFRFAAKKLEELSEYMYSLAGKSTAGIIAAFAVLLIFACVMAILQKKIPEMKGGGIPRCEGILRGILSFRRVITLVGTVIGSFISFFCGLPLGSEGPAVIIGTSIGGICSGPDGNKSAWSRYVMTGGAAAGFSVATGHLWQQCSLLLRKSTKDLHQCWFLQYQPRCCLQHILTNCFVHSSV